MSLDVSLKGELRDVPCRCSECGHEHTRKEADEYFEANVTHNLAAMADEAGVYQHIWRPEEIGITKAAQLVAPLRAAVALMRADPERFKKHNPSNGWGSYDRFHYWIERYADACAAHPEANIHVCR